ncbi:MAG TPA: hypothetical protein VHH32_11950 [Gemmatimonadales bacterium]|nr:hypothetical protein [Gemmatimonadales bacterium]
MTSAFEFARWAARLRTPLLLALIGILASCDNEEPLSPTNTSDAADEVQEIAGPDFTNSFRGGIPFGTFRLPTSEFGARYDGAVRNLSPSHLLRELRAIKQRGGKVIVMFAGPEHYYKTNGYFSLTKWKARINRYRKINFSSYIKDGTIIGHYLIDEPNDPRNWRNRPIQPSTLEEMAKFSKQIWPNMPTVIRTWPAYFAKKGSPRRYRYLDAAWAQYEVHRFPNVNEFVRSNVATARANGLALIIGMNIIHGGRSRRTQMTADQIRTYGSRLLESTYPCAFISWQYRDYYMKNRGVQQAMAQLRRKAKSRPSKSCWGAGRRGGG